MATKAYLQSVLNPEKTQTIRGIVVSPETGLPQGGVDVRLEHEKLPGLVVATTTTNAQGKFEFNSLQVLAIKEAQAKSGSPLFHAVFVSNDVPVGSTRNQQALSLSRASAPSFRLNSLTATSGEQSLVGGQAPTPSKQRQHISLRVNVILSDSTPVPRARVFVYDRPINDSQSWEPVGNAIVSGHPIWSEIEDEWTHIVTKGATGADGTTLLDGNAAMPIPEGVRRYVMVRVIVSDTVSVVRRVAVNPTEERTVVVPLSDLPAALTVYARLDALSTSSSFPVLTGPVPDLLARMAEPGLPTVTDEHVAAYRLLRNSIAPEESPLDPCLFAMAYATRPTTAAAPAPGYTTGQSLSAVSLASYVERADAEGLIDGASPTEVATASRIFIRFMKAWSLSYHDLTHPSPMVRYAYFALAESSEQGASAFPHVLTSFEWAGGEASEDFWTDVASQASWGDTGLPTLAAFRELWERFELLEHRVDVFARWYGLISDTAAQAPVATDSLVELDELTGRSDAYWALALFDQTLDEVTGTTDREYLMRVRGRHDERSPSLAVARRIEGDPNFEEFDDEDGSAAEWLRSLADDNHDFGIGVTRATTHLNGVTSVAIEQKSNLLALERLLRVRWDLEVAAELWSSPQAYRSASDISRTSRTNFENEFATSLTRPVAQAVYDAAGRIVAAISDAAQFAVSLTATGVDEHVANPEDIGQVLDEVTGGLGSLLQEVSGQGCEACNSVLGPSAYLIDLLGFLRSATAEPLGDGTTRKLHDEFEARRPRVKLMSLDCDAVNTPVPTLQILCEELTEVVDTSASSVRHSLTRWPWNAAPSISGARTKAWERALLFRVSDATSLRHTSLFAEDRIHPMAFGVPGSFATDSGWNLARWRMAETRLGLHLPTVATETSTAGGWLSPSFDDLLPDSLVQLDDGPGIPETVLFGSSATGTTRVAELRTFMRTTGLSLESVEQLLRVPPFSLGASPLQIRTISVSGKTSSVLTRATPSIPLTSPLNDTDLLNLYRFVTLRHSTGLSFQELSAGLCWTGLLTTASPSWDLNVVHALASLVSIADALQQPLPYVATWFCPDLSAIPALSLENADAGMSRWQELFGTLEPGTGSERELVSWFAQVLTSALGIQPDAATAFLRFVVDPESQSRRSVLQSAYRYNALARALQMPLEQLLSWCDITESPMFGMWGSASSLPEGAAGPSVRDVAERIVTTEFSLQRLTSLRASVADDLGQFQQIVYGDAPLPPSLMPSLLSWLQAAVGSDRENLKTEAGITAYAQSFEAVVERTLGGQVEGTMGLAKVQTTTTPSVVVATVLDWLELLLASLSDANVESVFQNQATIFSNAARTMHRLGVIRDHFGLSDAELRWLAGSDPDGDVDPIEEEIGETLPSLFILPTDPDLSIDDERSLCTSWLRMGAWLELRDREMERRERTSTEVSALVVLASLLTSHADGTAAQAGALGVDTDALPPIVATEQEERFAEWQARETTVLRIARAGSVFAPRRIAASTAWSILGEIPLTASSLSHDRATALLDAFESSLTSSLPASTVAKLTEQVSLAELETRRDLLMARVRTHAFATANHIWNRIGLAQDPNLYVYERLFIDPLLTAQVRTTRVVEATLAIQTLVNRAVLGQLELVNGTVTLRHYLTPQFVQPWEWLNRYRQWEAARKILLWPENWMRAELRDDQTGAFRQFRESLGSGAVPLEVARKAYLRYLRELQRIGHMQPAAISWEVDDSISGKSTRTSIVLASPPDKPNQLYWSRRTEVLNKTTATRFSTWSPWADTGVEADPKHVALVAYRGETHLFSVQFEQVAHRPPPTSTTAELQSLEDQAAVQLFQAELEHQYVAQLHHSTLEGSTWSELTSAGDVKAPVRVPVVPLDYDGASDRPQYEKDRPQRPRGPHTFFLLASTAKTGESPTIGLSVFYRMQAKYRDAATNSSNEVRAVAAGREPKDYAGHGRYLRDPYELAHFQYSVTLGTTSVEELRLTDTDGYIEVPNAIWVEGQRTHVSVPMPGGAYWSVIDWRLSITNPDYVLPRYLRPGNRLYAQVDGATQVLLLRVPVAIICPVDSYLARAGLPFTLHDSLYLNSYVGIPEPYTARVIGPTIPSAVPTDRTIDQPRLVLNADQIIAASDVRESGGFTPRFVGQFAEGAGALGNSLPNTGVGGIASNPPRGATVSPIRGQRGL